MSPLLCVLRVASWSPFVLAAVLLTGLSVGCGGASLLVAPASGDPAPSAAEFSTAAAVESQNQLAGGLNAFSNHDVVLLGVTPGADGDISLYVRIKTVWAYIAGLSHTSPSQINCSIEHIRADPTGAVLYRGGGIVHVVPTGGAFRCWIKSATLELVHRTPGARDELGRFELTGKFTAVDDPREHRYIVRRFERVQENLEREPPEPIVPLKPVDPRDPDRRRPRPGAGDRPPPILPPLPFDTRDPRRPF